MLCYVMLCYGKLHHGDKPRLYQSMTYIEAEIRQCTTWCKGGIPTGWGNTKKEGKEREKERKKER